LDDDPALLKGLGRLLVSAGITIKTFSDPEEFLAYAKVHRNPVAIIDIWMPQMNGLEVQTRLRAISPSTRVIICTGKEDTLVRATAMKAGASAFFLKPFDEEEFLTAVRMGLAGVG
jgi:two-component system response regulator FixJ